MSTTTTGLGAGLAFALGLELRFGATGFLVTVCLGIW